MEQRSLDVTLISANDLKRVSGLCKMRCYAVVWVERHAGWGRIGPLACTHLDKKGGTTPRWDLNVSLGEVPDAYFCEPAAGGAWLKVEVFHKAALSRSCCFVGTASIPLAELQLQLSRNKESSQPLAFPLTRRSGRAHGSVNLYAHVGDKSIFHLLSASSSSSSSSSSADPYLKPGSVYSYPPVAYGRRRRPKLGLSTAFLGFDIGPSIGGF